MVFISSFDLQEFRKPYLKSINEYEFFTLSISLGDRFYFSFIINVVSGSVIKIQTNIGWIDYCFCITLKVCFYDK